MSVSITALDSSDHDEWLQLWQGYLAFYETVLDETITQSTFERLVSGSDMHGAIARDGTGRAVGIVHWLAHAATWTTSTYCYLEDLFVTRDARGSGVGAALIEHVRTWAAAAGSVKVYWLTAETNLVARGLYDQVADRSGLIQYEIKL